MRREPWNSPIGLAAPPRLRQHPRGEAALTLLQLAGMHRRPCHQQQAKDHNRGPHGGCRPCKGAGGSGCRVRGVLLNRRCKVPDGVPRSCRLECRVRIVGRVGRGA